MRFIILILPLLTLACASTPDNTSREPTSSLACAFNNPRVKPCINNSSPIALPNVTVYDQLVYEKQGSESNFSYLYELSALLGNGEVQKNEAKIMFAKTVEAITERCSELNKKHHPNSEVPYEDLMSIDYLTFPSKKDLRAKSTPLAKAMCRVTGSTD